MEQIKEVRGSLMMASWSLLAREWLRFLRQRNRLIGALATPLLFWAFFGAGFGNSFNAPGSARGMDYMTYFFPGTLMLVVLFTAIFSSISIIEDRNQGFLQGVLVAPVSRLAIVLGKVLGSASLGFVQGVLLLMVAPLVGMEFTPHQFMVAALEIMLIAFSLSGLGFLLAWRMDSVQGFHAMMNLLLFPMWLLSGALFPLAGAQGWMQGLMLANPLTYGLGALRHTLYAPGVADSLGDPNPASSVGVLLGFTVLVLALAVWAVNRPLKK